MDSLKMQNVIVFLASCATVYAVPRSQQRIVGGWETSVEFYPEVTSLLYSYTGVGHRQSCGGAILNTRSVLTAAHCVANDIPSRWRFRVGSSYANKGGRVYKLSAIIIHAGYNEATFDNDIAILRSGLLIIFGANVKPASIALNNVSDNQPLWGVGWGATAQGAASSDVLRHTLVWSVNQTVCRQRYTEIGHNVTDNMLCAGWLDVGGRDQCQGDSGSPLFHNKLVVGVCSWGHGCAQARYPGVNTRVAGFAHWIRVHS